MSQDKPVLSRAIKEINSIELYLWRVEGGELWDAARFVRETLEALAPHNDHEPPQQTLGSSAKDSDALHQGPASGSPDELEELAKVERQLQRCDTPVSKALDQAAQALRALAAERQKLSKNFEIAEGAWRAEKGRAESLQHQLAQRGEWLHEALKGWDEWMGAESSQDRDWDNDEKRIATIRKALGEI